MLFWLILAAQAHVGDLIITLDLERGASPVVDVEVSIGLTLWEGSEAQWVCHEAVTAPKVMRSPLYARSGADVRLAWLPDPLEGRDGATLFRSEDGCDWPAVSELASGIKVAAFTPHAPERAWALTVDGQLWRSGDSATSFQELTPPGWTGNTDAISFGSDDVVYLSGADATYLNGQIGRSEDNGDTWTVTDFAIPAGLTPPVKLKVMWVDPNDADTVLMAVDQIGADTLHRTTDGGQNWTEVLQADITLLSMEQSPEGVLYVIGGAPELLRSSDLGLSWESLPAPLSVGFDVADGVLLGVNAESMGGQMVNVWEDGYTTPALAVWDITQPLACPEASHQAQICLPLWDTLSDRLVEPQVQPRHTGGADTGSTDTGTPGPGCGCNTRPGTAPGLWLGLLLAAAARRRTGGATRRPAGGA